MHTIISDTSLWPLLLVFAAAAAIIIPSWRIFKKSGYPQWLSLLMVVPIVNLIMLYLLGWVKPRRTKRQTTSSSTWTQGCAPHCWLRWVR